MRLKERYQKNKPILVLYAIFTALIIFSWFFLAIDLQINGFVTTSENINEEVSSTFINGILTVTAIIFGFISIEIRNYFKNLFSILLVIFPMLFALILMSTMYFTSTILKGYPTVETAFWVFVFFMSVTIYGFCLLLTVARYKREQVLF